MTAKDLDLLRSIQKGLEGIVSTSASFSLSPLLWIDEAVLQQALSFLSIHDLARLRPCCQALNTIATSKEVWQPICEHIWPWVKESDVLTCLIPSSLEGKTTTTIIGGRGHQSSTTTSSSSSSFLGENRAYYDFCKRRVQAQALVQLPRMLRDFNEFDLAVDLRNMATGEVLYSAHGHINDDFGIDLFSFAGWNLQPNILATSAADASLLFEDRATAMAFFGEQGCLQLEFTIIDKTKQKIAELATLDRLGPIIGNGTRASLGWNNQGGRMDEEIWVFCSSHAVFLEGQLRLLRGLTLSIEHVTRKDDDDCEKLEGRQRSFGNAGGAGEEEGGDAAQQQQQPGGLIRCKVVSAWICDHQYLGDVEHRPSPAEVLQLFSELRWT